MSEVATLESILKSTRKICNLDENDDSFDVDILIHLNSVLMILSQLGIGPKNFEVEDETATWAELLEGITQDVRAVKSYVGLKVRMAVDPPTSATYKEVLENRIAELEWRLNISVDPGEEVLNV